MTLDYIKSLEVKRNRFKSIYDELSNSVLISPQVTKLLDEDIKALDKQIERLKKEVNK